MLAGIFFAGGDSLEVPLTRLSVVCGGGAIPGSNSSTVVVVSINRRRRGRIGVAFRGTRQDALDCTRLRLGLQMLFLWCSADSKQKTGDTMIICWS